MIKEYYVMPPLTKAVQWTGDNYKEVQGFIEKLDFQGMDPETNMLMYRDRHDLPINVEKGNFIVKEHTIKVLTEEVFCKMYQESPIYKGNK